MSKICSNCGKEVPDNARFCMDCGTPFDNNKVADTSTGSFNLGMLFIILIIAAIIVGGIFILTSGNGGSGNNGQDVVETPESLVELTITEVSGWDSDSSSKKSYTLYTEALFDKVPDDLKGYNVKTTYYDDNDKAIGHEIESLDDIYYDSNYALSFGFYTTYSKPNPDHVTVEIIKSGNVVDSFTEQIDTSKISYLN